MMLKSEILFRKFYLSGFNDFEYCFRSDQIDKINDQFQLERTNRDGVCITSLTVDGKQMLVGKNNDLESFWIDGDQNNCLENFMGTTKITIQNGLGKFQIDSALRIYEPYEYFVIGINHNF